MGDVLHGPDLGADRIEAEQRPLLDAAFLAELAERQEVLGQLGIVSLVGDGGAGAALTNGALLAGFPNRQRSGDHLAGQIGHVVGEAVEVPEGHDDGGDVAFVHHGVELLGMVIGAGSHNGQALVDHLAVVLEHAGHLRSVDGDVAVGVGHVGAQLSQLRPHMPDVGGLNAHPVLVGLGSLEGLGGFIVVVPGLDVFIVDAGGVAQLLVVEDDGSADVEADAVVLAVLGVDIHTGLDDVVQLGLNNVVQGQQLDIALQEVGVLAKLDIDQIGSALAGNQSVGKVLMHFLEGIDGLNDFDLTVGVGLVPSLGHLLVELHVNLLEGPELDLGGLSRSGGLRRFCLAADQHQHGQSQKQRDDFLHYFFPPYK